MRFENLLSPIKIGSMEVKNRIVMPPMGTDQGNTDGSINDGFSAYYVERAKGGFGLITTEVMAVDPLGRSVSREPGIWSDDHISDLKKMIDECHKYGAKVSVQLHHAGRETTYDYIHDVPVGVTAEPCPTYRNKTHELTTEECYDLIEKFGNAAYRAYQAGADCVELHGGHSYLLAQFTSQLTNHRLDEFGGSFENRLRFSKLVIKNIKKKVGDEFPVVYRISGEELTPGGNTERDARVIAQYLEKVGVDAIHVTYGRMDYSGRYVVPPASLNAGYSLESAAKIREAISIPVITVGRHTNPFTGEDAIKNGQVDLVSYGRQGIADPYFPTKVAEGRLDEIITCIGCNQGCIHCFAIGNSVTCLANPFTGREEELKMLPANEPKEIMVIGAGPAGMIAAGISAARGHKVKVYEKQHVPGGDLRIGGIPPTKGNIIDLIRSYYVNCKKYGVEFFFNTDVDEELIRKEKADIVIVATGSQPLIPPIEGINDVGAVDARDVLVGKIIPGQNVLIIGGGLVGAETADYLSQGFKRNVTIVEMLSDIAIGEEANNRASLLDRLDMHNVNIITGAKVNKFIEGGVFFTKEDENQLIDGFDTIILAMGTKSNNPFESLSIDGVDIHVIGDAYKASDALAATAQAAKLAVKI